MRINVCVPTRGKPEYIQDFVWETARNATLTETRVILGMDADDHWDSKRNPNRTPTNVTLSIEPREDSLGAKYNRCARAYDADLYVMSMDDVAISTKGWDEILVRHAALFKDGIGYLYFGKEMHGERLPSMIAVTRKIVDLIGFCPEFFPFWWNNTWVDEVATLIGGYGRRALGVPIETRYPQGELPEPPRRDVTFWAQFFDLTRPLRIAQAGTLIEAMDDGPTAKAILQATMRPKLRELAVWNSNLRDPDWGDAMTKVTEPRDARHQRLMDRARAEVEKLAKVA